MASTRVRFTVSYVAIALGAIVAFAVSLWVARVSLAREQLLSQSLLYADRLLGDIRFSQQTGTSVFIADSTQPGGVALTRDIRGYLDRRPGYFVLIGAQNQVLYNSELVRMMPPADGDQLLQYVTRIGLQDGLLVSLVGDTLNPHKLFLVARRG